MEVSVGDAAWLKEETRERVRDCIRAIESTTGAEVVTTVSVRSGHYRHADYLVGALLSLTALLFYFFYPDPLYDDIAILLVIASFGVGAFLSAAATGIRRILVSRKLMDENVRAAARAHFVDQGISVTRERTGVLVYVSLFERRVEVVPDVGVPVDRMTARWKEAVAAIDAAARRGVEPFLKALEALGPLLTEIVPRSADDVNELPDDMVQA
jgi:putative membrane protein